MYLDIFSCRVTRIHTCKYMQISVTYYVLRYDVIRTNLNALSMCVLVYVCVVVYMCVCMPVYLPLSSCVDVRLQVCTSQSFSCFLLPLLTALHLIDCHIQLILLSRFGTMFVHTINCIGEGILCSCSSYK